MPAITRKVFSQTIFHTGILYYFCDKHQVEHGIKFTGSGGPGIARILVGNNTDPMTLVSPFQPDPAVCDLSISVVADVITQSS